MSDDLRTQVARIIQPRAYELKEQGCDYRVNDAAIEDALAKADAILALTQGEWRAIESGWQPIDTAPRDGQHFLACQAGTTFGWYDGQRAPAVQTVVHWWGNPGEEGFYTSVNELEPQRPFEATHWKPLDAPAPAVQTPNTFEVGQPAPYFCPACQAVPCAGYCKLAGCPTAPAVGTQGEWSGGSSRDHAPTSGAVTSGQAQALPPRDQQVAGTDPGRTKDLSDVQDGGGKP